MNAADFFKADSQRSLAEAAANGRTDQLKMLLSKGADINANGLQGMTALYWALAHRSKSGVSWLLQHNANPNVLFARDGTSATSLAARLEDPWFLREILAHGGDLNIRNPINGRTPLAEAIAYGLDENARILISAGADMNTVDTTGLTPVLYAAANQKYELVYDMLIAGADPTIQIARSNGKTLLWVIGHSRVPPSAAAYQWQLKVIELLKQRGLDVEHGQ